MKVFCYFVLLYTLLVTQTAIADPLPAIQNELKNNPAQHFSAYRSDFPPEKVNQLLERIYAERQYKAFWHAGGTLTERGEIALSYIESAATEGLVPSDYRAKELIALSRKSDTQSRARLDILLTMAVGRYVGDLRNGRLGIKKINPELFASARTEEVDVLTVVMRALQASDIRGYFKEQAPPISQYNKLKDLLSRYRNIAREGGWPAVPGGSILKPGMSDPRVPILKQTLGIMGDYKTASDPSLVYDSTLEAAVKNFQHRHGLKTDGVIGPGTLRALNIPVETRVRQIVVNMERWRWNTRSLEGRTIVTNIASFLAGGLYGEKPELLMSAVVGKTYHMTPVFSDMIERVEFNPYWNVPASIARNEYLPKLRKDPKRVVKSGIRIFTRWGDEASEIDPLTYDWQNTTAGQIAGFHLRQELGDKNALGRVKFMFPNEYNVYMHDTPAHSLFNREERAFSHGCIRLSEPLKMAEYILSNDDPSWNMERIKQVVASGKNTSVNLKTPLPVVITYRTVVVEENGRARFYNDIYDRDIALEKAIYRQS